MYEITIRELTPFTDEENAQARTRNNGFDSYPGEKFADTNFHEMRVVYAMLSKEEFEAVKKAVISVA